MADVVNCNDVHAGSSRKMSWSSRELEGSWRSRRREKYTIAACNECKKKKIKCTGNRPCRRCDTYKTTCIYSRGAAEGGNASQSALRLTALGDEVRNLKGQLDQLRESLLEKQSKDCDDRISKLSNKNHCLDAEGLISFDQSDWETGILPTQPHFLGPTSSAFSFNVANSTLQSMGIQADQQMSAIENSITSRSESLEPSLQAHSEQQDPLLCLGITRISRALEIYKEELHPVYPFICVDEMTEKAPYLYQDLQKAHNQSLVTDKYGDIKILKIMVASAMVVEGGGQSKFAAKLLTSVEDALSRRTKSVEINMKQLQLFTLMSIYHFHCDEEVLAWRTIGTAARIALELGLHQKESLLLNIPEPQARHWATRLFWCIYILDRRWSFGIGMPFALHDSDIDPDLPQLNGNVPYLECMVRYGRLCSKVWEAVVNFGGKNIDIDCVAYLEFQIDQWRLSIPTNLQLRNAELGASEEQPRSLQRLRVLLHLRANQMRILLHRHNILSALRVAENLPGAQLVIDAARDTIRVLLEIREQSTIYETQQNCFNYFLVTALSAIFLAVCHAPAEFGDNCRDDFFSALALLKYLSSHSYCTERLWKSLQGLKNIALQLGLKPRTQSSPANHHLKRLQVSVNNHCISAGSKISQGEVCSSPATINSATKPKSSTWNFEDKVNTVESPDMSFSTPDMSQIGHDLTNYFETYGNLDNQGQQPNFKVRGQDSKELSMFFEDFLYS